MNAEKRLMRPCTIVYSVMLLLTLTTFVIGTLGMSGLWVSLLVLLFALIKGQMVGEYFMGLTRVRGLWHWVIFLWLFIPGILIGTAFYLAG
ncbi:MAG: cytochrome C oxidase subunit IV family protein [Pseudomonadota bacterium]|nr:cytochrome C oxidase subunit IV family protein [Pseudomonadota bacterium]